MKSPIAIEAIFVVFCFAAGVSAATPEKQNDDKPAEKKKLAWEPTDHYRPQEIEGWTVLVNKSLLEKDCDDLRKRTLRLLEDHLYRITRVVPAEACAKLQKIRIWVERTDSKFPCMCYHESEDWLRDNGVNPEKVNCVELANPETFLDWTHEQPWMVLHELAHGYHAQVLTHNHKGIHDCYDRAVASKTYESVLHWDGRKVRHYALNNQMEYFAEATEAFFGTNDYYPFVRSELKEHDPKMYEVLKEVWGVK